MRQLAHQAYLRTRLAILHARMRDTAQIRALMQLTAEQLSEELGLDQLHSKISNSQRMESFELSQMQDWLDELSALLRPLHGSSRDVLIQWARRYELYNLKAIIRGKLGELPNSEIKKTLFRLPGFLSLDHNKLLNTDGVEQLLRQLSDTPYRRIAEQALLKFKEHPDPFLLDATLDQQFYNDLIARVRKLDNPDRDALVELTGHIIDRHNLIWLLRYRFNYHLQPSETLYLLINSGLRIDRALLRQLVNADTQAILLQQLPDSIKKIIGSADSIMTIESQMQNSLSRTAHQVLRHSPSTLAATLAYLVLRFYEMSSIKAIVQARFNGFSDNVLEQALFPLVDEAA